MNSTPLVSIIMAAKDTAPYIAACLDSIVNQTYANWELLVVNDHSTDETPAILEKYATSDKRIKVVHSNRPRLIPSLQEGYKHCTGELLNRMDSDDIMPLDKLEVMVNEWLKYGKGNVIAGGTKHFVDEGEVGGGFIRYENWLNNVARNNSHYEEIYTECVIPSHCWMLHKDDFNAVGGFDSNIYPEDYDLTFRFYKKGLKVISLDKVLHFWRDRADRISRTWEEYKDNRYFDLKVENFYAIDRDFTRPLVLWGAGRNGKDMAKLLLKKENKFHWVCDSENKVGKDVYGIIIEHFNAIPDIDNPQIMVVVSSPDGKVEIKSTLENWKKKPVGDYWFFA
jgi:glycosyltransferase involved in cell wall biosynthesis